MQHPKNSTSFAHSGPTLKHLALVNIVYHSKMQLQCLYTSAYKIHASFDLDNIIDGNTSLKKTRTINTRTWHSSISKIAVVMYIDIQ